MNRRNFLAMTAALPALSPAFAAGNEARPQVALIMDDLGYRASDSYAALDLPKELTVAILPHTRHSTALAEGAAAFDHEVMLHMPMQATNGKFLGLGGLTVDMPDGELSELMDVAFASVPGARGFNNHMGSAFTITEEPLNAVMAQATQHVEFFIDSVTHAKTIASQIARQHGLKTARRDVFLDDANDRLDVPARARTLLRRTGEVPTIAICHPRPETLEFLQTEWNWLEDHFELVPASQVVS